MIFLNSMYSNERYATLTTYYSGEDGPWSCKFGMDNHGPSQDEYHIAT